MNFEPLERTFQGFRLKEQKFDNQKNVKFLFAQVSNFSQEFLLYFCIQWMMYLQERNNEIRWNRV